MVRPVLCPGCLKVPFESVHDCDHSNVPPKPDRRMTTDNMPPVNIPEGDWLDRDHYVEQYARAYAERQTAELRNACKSYEIQANRDALRLEELETWDGLMRLLDKHWPASIFPTLPDDDKRDSGPRIVSLLRWVAELRAEVEGLKQGERAADAEVGRLRVRVRLLELARQPEPGPGF